MFLFRFIVVFVISFLLLSPFIRSVSHVIEKPLIVIAQDNSESVLFSKDSAFIKTKYQENLKQLITDFSNDYEVITYSFGDKVNKNNVFSFNEKQTDISEIIAETKNKFVNRNVGALIIASDGIFNKGSNPLYSISDLQYPVYTIAIGDTAVKKDAAISKVVSNKIAFLGNKFPVQLVISAKELDGKASVVNVVTNNKKVFSKPINIKGKEYFETINFEVTAEQKGIQRCFIEIVAIDDEQNKKNNFREILVDVIDSKQKVLLIANSPHPDIAVIRNALEENQNVSVEYLLADKVQNIVLNHSIVILHQLPSKNNNLTKLLSEISSKGVPALYILGTQSSFDNINNLKLGFDIKQTRNSFDEAQAVFNRQFVLFQLSDEICDFIAKAPPLIAPFGDYKISDATNILLFQKISTVTTSRPLIYFNTSAETKTGFIAGEGIWRWKLHNYMTAGSHELLNEFINKVVQFLALKVAKESFIINFRKLINENEQQIFEAEVYNEAFELNNSGEVNLEITNSDNKKFTYVFDKTSGGYSLNAGTLPVGDYSFKATAKHGKKEYAKVGNFSVVAINAESENTVADYKLMKQIAEKGHGASFTAFNFQNLKDSVKSNPDIVPVSYEEKQLTELISLKWLFFVILLLATAEWFFRKYLGSY